MVGQTTMKDAMTNTNGYLKEFALRFIAMAGAGMLAGYLMFGSFIVNPVYMSFQFTVNSITAGLSYALLKWTSKLRSVVVLFCWFVLLTVLEDVNNRWMYLLNCTYIVGISGAMFAYLYLCDKPILNSPIRRIALLSLLVGLVNTLHVIILAAISLGSSMFQNPHFFSNCEFNFEAGSLIGLAAGLGAEIVDRSFVQRTFTALKLRTSEVDTTSDNDSQAS